MVKFFLLILFISAIVIRGYFLIDDKDKYFLKSKVGESISIEGKISSFPEKKDFSQIFILKNKEGNFVRVATDRYKEYKYGDEIVATGKILLPRNFEGKGGRVFDYVNYLGKDKIYYEFKKAEVKILKKGDLNKKSVSVALFLFREKFLNNIKKVLGEPHASLALGLVVGEKSSLGKDLIDDFRKSGLIHIVVLSGYNITIIALSIRRFLLFLPRNVGILFGILGIILFAILVGGGATVVRSSIMAIVALFGELARKDYSVSRALFIAALLMIFINPLIILYDPSFQLSFLATLGLVTLSSPLEKKLGFITEKFGVRNLVASTLATQIFVSPLIFHMIGELSIVSIFVNILVLPFIPITMLFVFITGALGFFTEIGSKIVAGISYLLLSYELIIVKYFARLPFAVIRVQAFSFWIVLGFYTFYLAVFWKLPSIFSQFIFSKKSSM